MLRALLLLALASLASCTTTRALAPAPVELRYAHPAYSARAESAAEATALPSRHAVVLGARQMDDDFFYEPVDEPLVLGYEFSRTYTSDSPFGMGFEVGFQIAGANEEVAGLDVTSAFAEFAFGVRGRATVGPAEFYLGAGPTFLGAGIDIEDGPDDYDTSLGFYAHAGVLFQIARHFAAGLDVRQVVGTDITFDGFVDTDADYTQVAVVLSF